MMVSILHLNALCVDYIPPTASWRALPTANGRTSEPSTTELNVIFAEFSLDLEAIRGFLCKNSEVRSRLTNSYVRDFCLFRRGQIQTRPSEESALRRHV